jgi:hypothetical protein
VQPSVNHSIREKTQKLEFFSYIRYSLKNKPKPAINRAWQESGERTNQQ